jgi:hypothetical protein
LRADLAVGGKVGDGVAAGGSVSAAHGRAHAQVAAWRTTRTSPSLAASAWAAVPSLEPSSTTMIS